MLVQKEEKHHWIDISYDKYNALLGMKQSTFSDIIGWLIFPHFVLLSPDLYWDGTGILKTNPNY